STRSPAAPPPSDRDAALAAADPRDATVRTPPRRGRPGRRVVAFACPGRPARYGDPVPSWFPGPLGRDRDRLHLVLMLALTFSTGIADAVGYLGLDRVFTGNMTGNVVILGMALAGADGLPVAGPLLA